MADRLALGKPTVSAAVDVAVQARAARPRGAAEDQRASTLSLTPAGEQALAAVEAEMLARLSDLARRTPDPDAVLESLAQLGPALDELAEERLADGSATAPAVTQARARAGCAASAATCSATAATSCSRSAPPCSAAPARPSCR